MVAEGSQASPRLAPQKRVVSQCVVVKFCSCVVASCVMEVASLVATAVAGRRRVRLVVSSVVVDDDRGTASDYLSRTACYGIC